MSEHTSWPAERCALCPTPPGPPCLAQQLRHQPICAYVAEGRRDWLAFLQGKDAVAVGLAASVRSCCGEKKGSAFFG